MRQLLGIVLASALLIIGGLSLARAYSGRGTNCNGSLPCPRWVGVTISAPSGADWTVTCPGGPYSCNGITGTGTHNIAQYECSNGACAGAGTYSVRGSLAGSACVGDSQNVPAYTASTFTSPFHQDVQLSLTCTVTGTVTPPPSLSPTPPPTFNNDPIGTHELTDCAAAWGWAFDPDHAGNTTVVLYANGPAGAGGILAGIVPATGARPDVGAVYPGRTNSGWYWTIPGAFKDGVPHNIYAYATNKDSNGVPDGPNPLLPGSPMTISCIQPPNGTLNAAVCGSANGYAADLQGSPVDVTVYDGPAGSGPQIGSGLADPTFIISLATFNDGQLHTLYGYAQDIPTTTWYQMTFTQVVACAPEVTLNASPVLVANGGTSTLDWNVSNAVACNASPAGWFVPGSVVDGVGAGTSSSSPLLATTNFRLTCTNAAGQSFTASQAVAVNPAPPLVGLSATPKSVLSGATSVLTWNTAAAVTCSASGGWTGGKSTAGSETTSVLTTPTTFTLTCTNAGGSTTASTIVTIKAPLPTVTLSADPVTVLNGATSVLTWTSSGALSCAASQGWSGAKSTSGNETTGPITGTTTFTLTCTNASGNASASTTVGASAPFPRYREVRPGSQPTPVQSP